MQTNSQPVKANKPQPTTHPHTTNNTKPHITPPQNCPHAITDNLGYTNCTRSNSTITLCTTPCPYKRATASASRGERCHPERVGESGFFQAVFGETSRFQAVQLRCHLSPLEAVEVVS
ncbi:MAG: hypothetical protein QXG09_04650 [Candidatus Bathyarchaeia archaeon]